MRRPTLRELDAVLFDFDGTLVHTQIDFARMRQDILDLVAEHEVDPLPYRELDSLSVIERVSHEVRDALAFRERAEEILVAIEVAGAKNAELANGANATIAWLKGNAIRVAIVTRNCSRVVEPLIARFNIATDVLVARDHTPRTKPDPVHLRLALSQLSATAERALMVGDHPLDVIGGRAAGMFTCAVLSATTRVAFDAPDLVIESLDELPRILS